MVWHINWFLDVSPPCVPRTIPNWLGRIILFICGSIRFASILLRNRESALISIVSFSSLDTIMIAVLKSFPLSPTSASSQGQFLWAWVSTACLYVSLFFCCKLCISTVATLETDPDWLQDLWSLSFKSVFVAWLVQTSSVEFISPTVCSSDVSPGLWHACWHPDSFSRPWGWQWF